MVASFLRYWWRAGNLHGLHSPFVYALYRDHLRDRHPAPPISPQIEALRQHLFTSTDTITVTDFGAGSRRDTGRIRRVSRVARTAQKPKRYAWLLYRLVLRFKASHILELGTSLGLTTAYLAHAAVQTGGRVHSFEGCPNTAALARKHLHQLGLSAEIRIGNLDDTLATYLENAPPIDLAFFDANHRYTPTVQYFTNCLTKIHNDTLFIFDDIHWSADMEQAWETIKAHPATRVTIDLFGVGLVFFRTEQPKQHFILRF